MEMATALSSNGLLNRKMDWETATNNWAAVCAGNVGGAMMYLEPELFRQQLPRLRIFYLLDIKYNQHTTIERGTCNEI